MIMRRPDMHMLHVEHRTKIGSSWHLFSWTWQRQTGYASAVVSVRDKRGGTWQVKQFDQLAAHF